MTNPTSSPDINEVRLSGALAFDPVTTKMSGGDLLLSFKINTMRAWRANGQRREALDTHTVVAWNELAKTAESFKRGDRVSVYGRLQTRHLNDPTRGIPQTKVEIVAETILRHHDSLQ